MPRLLKSKKKVTVHSIPKMSEASASSSTPSTGPIQHHGIRRISLAESDADADSLALAFADDDVAMYFIKMN